MRRVPCFLLVVLSTVTLCSGWGPTARGDWDPDDSHKMHFPQLPDPNGWDVRISNPRDQMGWIVADDWRCTETGPVGRVHFWVSWMQEVIDPQGIVNIHLSIHENIPAGEVEEWSIPGDQLWAGDLGPEQFTVRHYGEGAQGWYDPVFGDVFEDDHSLYYQVNVDIPDPFIQQEGEIYWLDISVDLWGESETGKLGWKTSLDHFEDDAVYWDEQLQRWIELRDPVTQESLDMAFVVDIPEPATCWLLAVGLLGVACVAYRTRRGAR